MKTLSVKIILNLLSLFYICSFSFGQSPLPEWVSTYGNDPNLQYLVNDMKTDKAGNVYVYGFQQDTSGVDTGIIIKYNSQGIKQWISKYKGLWNGGKITLDKDGNVYVMSRSYSFSNSQDYVTVKYSTNGNLLWSAVYDGPAHAWDDPYAIVTDDSLNVYLTGEVDTGNVQGFGTIKYDSSGVRKWVAIYSSGNGDKARDLAVDSHHNVYVTGYSLDTINVSCLTIKYDINGNKIWENRYLGRENAGGLLIKIWNDSIIYVGGEDDINYEMDYLLIRYDSSGNQIWHLRYDTNYLGDSLGDDEAQAMAMDDSGNVYLTGIQFLFTAYDAYRTIKVDKNGNLKWSNYYDGGYGWDHPFGLVIDKSANIYITGYSQDSLYLNQNIIATIKYDTNGNALWVAKFVESHTDSYNGAYIGLDSLNNVYIAGACMSVNSPHLVALKYDWTIGINEPINYTNQITIYPNPLTSSSILQLNTQIKNAEVVIYDVLGKEMMRRKMDGDRMEIERGSLVSGVYFVRVRDEERQWVEKMVVE